MTLDELISSYRLQSRDERHSVGGSDGDLLCTDELLTVFANEAQVEACRRARLLISTDVLQVPAGAAVLTLPTGAICINRAFADGAPLTVITADAMDEAHPGWQDKPVAAVPQYLISGVDTGAYALWPRPQQGCAIRLTAARLPLKAMRNGNDKPEIRPELHAALVEWMLYRAYSRADPDLVEPAKAASALANFEAEFGRKTSGRNEEWVRSGQGMMPGPIA